MGLFDAFKKDADTLYFTLSELPRPRQAAIFSISFGKQVVATSHLQMDDAGMEKACRVTAFHIARIQGSGYRRVVYQNLPGPVQARLEELLAKKTPPIRARFCRAGRQAPSQVISWMRRWY